jgi:hypothetical protein
MELLAVVVVVVILLMIVGLSIWATKSATDGYYGPDLSQKHRIAYGGVPLHAGSVGSETDRSYPHSIIIPNSMVSLREMQKDSMQTEPLIVKDTAPTEMVMSKRRDQLIVSPEMPNATATSRLQIASKGRKSYN